MSTVARDRRNTFQKRAVTESLERATGFISAGDLHHRLNEEGTTVGLATVYRQLNALVDAGLADTVPVAGGQLFRACDPGDRQRHHHHLVCENCGAAVEIDPPSEEWITTTATRNGFTVTRHILEVFGRCAACAT